MPFAFLPIPVFAGIGFVYGLLFGSFANVCISRMPHKQSVITPRSRCPKCEKPIRAWENIPVISYLLLGGKCRNCGISISMMYPGVELVTGLLMAAVFYKFGFSWECLIFSIVMPTLVVITMIDIEHKIMPDLITLPGIVFGFAAGSYMNGPMDSFLGFLVGGGSFWLLAEVYFRTRGKMGMGGGDIKYIAAAGALLGWVQILVVIFIGALSGALFGSLGMSVKKLNFLSQIPFGPFLALATILSIFFGNELVTLYIDFAFPVK